MCACSSNVSQQVVTLSQPIEDVRRAANVLHHAACKLGAEGNGILFAIEGLYSVHRVLEAKFLKLAETLAYEETTS